MKLLNFFLLLNLRFFDALLLEIELEHVVVFGDARLVCHGLLMLQLVHKKL